MKAVNIYWLSKTFKSRENLISIKYFQIKIKLTKRLFVPNQILFQSVSVCSDLRERNFKRFYIQKQSLGDVL